MRYNLKEAFAMATTVNMKNTQTGMFKKGFVGYSWTYLFFGCFVPLVRGELSIFLIHFVITFFTFGIWQIVFSFMYNKSYTTRLMDQGYKFADRDEVNANAAFKLGVDLKSHLGS
jgi:hypothetical protein